MSPSASHTRPLGRDRGLGKALVLSVPVFFAAIIGLAVASGLWSTTASHETGPAPNQLAGYQLRSVMLGPEAMAEIDELHGKEIRVVDAWVGHYQDGAAVWVAEAGSAAKAGDLLDDMVSRIMEGGSPFGGLEEQQYQGLTVYSVTDGRQLHLFYARGAKVVWVATPPGAEEEFFEAAFRKVS